MSWLIPETATRLQATAFVQNAWDKLQGSTPVNSTAARLMRKLPDQENGVESAAQQIARLERENLLLQQEIEWYLQSQTGFVDAMNFLAGEIRRLQKPYNT